MSRGRGSCLDSRAPYAGDGTLFVGRYDVILLEGFHRDGRLCDDISLPNSYIQQFLVQFLK